MSDPLNQRPSLMITSARILHFKSIAEAELDFRSLNVIVGANGAGKSNLIDALYFVRDCVVEDVDTAVTRRHGIQSIRQWSKSRPYHVVISMNFNSTRGSGSYRIGISSEKGDYRIIDESGEWFGEHPFGQTGEGAHPTLAGSTFSRDRDGKITIANGFNDESFRSEYKVPQSELYLSHVSNSRTRLSDFLFDPLAAEFKKFVSYSIYPNTIRQPQPVTRNDSLAPDGANLGSVLKRINSGLRRSKESLLDSLRVIMPRLEDFSVRSVTGYYTPVLRVREASGEAHDYNLSQVSDGTLRVLGLLSAFYQAEAPNIIAMEEPEQMVHPGALAVIADAAKEFVALAQSRQVFFTTHSPALLDLLPSESIIWTSTRDGLTSCGKVSERQMKMVREHLFTPGEILVAEGFGE